MLSNELVIGGAAFAPFLVLLVQLIRDLTPARFWKVDARSVALVLFLGPVLTLAGLVLGFLPDGTTAQHAALIGFSAALQAAGLYGSLKSTLGRRNA